MTALLLWPNEAYLWLPVTVDYYLVFPRGVLSANLEIVHFRGVLRYAIYATQSVPCFSFRYSSPERAAPYLQS